MPGVVSTMHFDTRALRARRATARIDPRLVALVAGMLIVFACCYAIGRATATGGSRVGEASGLQAASFSGAVPIQLSSAPPIAIPTVVRVQRHANVPTPAVVPIRTAPAPAHKLAPAVSDVPAPLPQATQPAPPKVDSAPQTPPASGPPTSTGGSKGEGGGSKPSTSGGGSFDSSG